MKKLIQKCREREREREREGRIRKEGDLANREGELKDGCEREGEKGEGREEIRGGEEETEYTAQRSAAKFNINFLILIILNIIFIFIFHQFF